MRPRGPVDRVAALLGDAAGALRRAREDRRARVVCHDEGGRTRTLDPEDPEAIAILDAADAMLDVVVDRDDRPESRT